MTEAEFLAGLPSLAFGAALLFCRLGAAAMLLPGLGEAEVPAPIRLGIGLAFVPLLLPLLGPSLPPAPDSGLEAARLLGLELLTGIWLGTLARVLAAALAVALQVGAVTLGLANILVPDPSLGSGASALGRLGTLAGIVLVLATGLHALPLRALAESYTVIPPGAAWPAGGAAEELVAAGAESLGLALRLAGPFLLLAVALNTALALLARVAPQIQAFALAAPAQILAGLALLALLGPALLGTFHAALAAGWSGLPGLR